MKQHRGWGMIGPDQLSRPNRLAAVAIRRKDELAAVAAPVYDEFRAGLRHQQAVCWSLGVKGRRRVDLAITGRKRSTRGAPDGESVSRRGSLQDKLAGMGNPRIVRLTCGRTFWLRQRLPSA